MRKGGEKEAKTPSKGGEKEHKTGLNQGIYTREATYLL